MALILNFDTSTQICSVCLSQDDTILSFRENIEGRNHASLLTIFIDEVLKESGKLPDDLDAIAVSKGPGSYTGLRIGVSTAKGMAYALDIPVLAIPTLKIMASGFNSQKKLDDEKTLLCPMIDARRMEVFTAFYTTGLQVFKEASADIIESDSYSEMRKDHRMIFFGDGAAKCENVLDGKEILIDKDYQISSRDMPLLSAEEYGQRNFENLAYFEPFYLKDFVATTPKKKLF
jgi:tRNA threonylcarbamoyladenosine biosynthesis protein TsaB